MCLPKEKQQQKREKYTGASQNKDIISYFSVIAGDLEADHEADDRRKEGKEE